MNQHRGESEVVSAARGTRVENDRFRILGIAVLLGSCAFLILAVRFSPNWIAFAREVREVTAAATSPAQKAAVEEAILSGFWGRGLHVIQQARQLDTPVDEPMHRIVRWRLLVPALAHLLHLPDWITLGLSHFGCLGWTIVLVGIGLRTLGPSRWRDALFLAIVAGASAPFHTSMGWLGYYDSWLVLGLFGVSYAPQRWVVCLACLAGPWIDERFVLGLPLALLVRRSVAGDETQSAWTWGRQQALLPLILVGIYAAVRLQLGGAGGSQTMAAYLRDFVIGQSIPFTNRLWGAWSGLGLGWVLVGCSLVLKSPVSASSRLEQALLALTVFATGLIGVHTALDSSRSMALLTPLVALGGIVAAQAPSLRKFHPLAWLAVGALLMPAFHVIGRVSVAVDNAWSPSLPLKNAQNKFAIMYQMGDRFTADRGKAAEWYRRSAQNGYPPAHNNLALLLAREGKTAEAQAHLEAALRLDPDYADAHSNFGELLASQPGREVEAIAHFERAIQLEREHFRAHYGLGLLLARQHGRRADALAHLAAAVRINPRSPHAHRELAGMLSDEPGKDAAAIDEYQRALHLKPDYFEAHNNLANLFARSGRSAAALQHYETAVRLAPGNPAAHYNFAAFLARLPGRQADAIAHYETAVRLKPDYGEAHYNLASLYVGQPGRHLDAIAHYEAAARCLPNVAVIHYNLAKQLEKIPERRKDALAHYSTAAKLDPSLSGARAAAQLLEQAGR